MGVVILFMDKQEQEINLKELFSLLLSKIQFIILITVLGAAAAFAYAKIFLPVEYTSSVSIYVKNTGAQSGEAANGEATQTGITAAKLLAEAYLVILDDDVVYDQVSEMLLNDYAPADLKNYFSLKETDGEYSIPAEQIRNMVEISSVNETEVIKIQTTTESAQISADICTYISDIAPDLLTRVTKAGSVETIGKAKVPDAPSSPNVKKITVIGALLGMVASAAAIIIINLLDNRISSADDIRQRYSIPVLAEIPDMETDAKEAAKYEY